MRIAVPKETAPLERRVGLVPDGVARLVKAGHSIVVEQGAGAAAGSQVRRRAGVSAGVSRVDVMVRSRSSRDRGGAEGGAGSAASATCSRPRRPSCCRRSRHAG